MVPQTIERLRSFKLGGFVEALTQQQEIPNQYVGLSFEERLTLLVDAEVSRRQTNRTNTLLKASRLSRHATVSDIDFSIPRGINKLQFLNLCSGEFLASGTNIIITGPTGIGKTFLASSLCHSLCSAGHTLRFQRTPQWLFDLIASQERRRLSKSLAGLRKNLLLGFDEWMRDPFSAADSRILLDLFDDRYNRASCLFVSQIPVANWHARFEDPTTADAILDRILHNSIRIELSGESMRKILASTQEQDVASLR
jgi:DNA replication protein DnaC